MIYIIDFKLPYITKQQIHVLLLEVLHLTNFFLNNKKSTNVLTAIGPFPPPTFLIVNILWPIIFLSFKKDLKKEQ